MSSRNPPRGSRFVTWQRIAAAALIALIALILGVRVLARIV